MTELAPHIAAFLREHLPRDRRASQHTVDSYSFAFQLLVCFVARRSQIRPCQIQIEQLTAPLILDFLDDLEKQRASSVRTRNLRLAAFKSFFRYLEFRNPAFLDLAQQVNAIPAKKCDHALVDYLERDELQAVLDAPDTSTTASVRDMAMLHLAYAAGLRVSELIGRRCGDLGRDLDTVHVIGKGRRQRVLPLWKSTRSVLRGWLKLRPDCGDDHLFLNARGTAMSRHGFAHRLNLHVETARRTVPSLAGKRVSPHVLRHSCAMHTLEATGDIRKVSMWLGHASMQSTEAYLRADPTEKLEALTARLSPDVRRGSFVDAPDWLLAILSNARTA